MGEPARKKSLYEEYLELPEHLTGEIIDGELFVSPRPAPKHLRTAARVMVDLGGSYDHGPDEPGGPGGWWILAEAELHLEHEQPMVPDLAGWRYERMPELPNEFFTVPPDWVCEVLSPSTARLDRWVKKQKYAQHGVSHVWLVDPIAKTLEVLRLQEGFYRETAFHQGDEKVRAEPFDAIELELKRWWQTRRES